MAKRAYARRYAQAIFQIALENKELDRWQSDITKIATLKADAALMAVLENPRLGFSDKTTFLAERLGDVQPLALNLLHLLILRDRVGIVDEIAEEYQRLWNSHRGIQTAEVITPVPLDDEGKSRVEKYLEAIVGTKVAVRHEVEPGLVGGVIARINGKLLDGSTRTRLRALREELSGVRR
ncbi:MAG: ATP synthase F1 subunit delta [Chloroflexi bacterium]|nr:ATP synthase F1 subunit delta [Chloroflexota bacterium]